MPKDRAGMAEPLFEGRSSMRRLSSMASLHQLLPFKKSRRSNTGADDSILSDNSSTNNSSALPSPGDAKSNPQVLREISHNARPAPPHAYGGFLRKNNYVSIPDSSSGGIPRSKTFSNLPLPIKSRKHHSHNASDIENKELPQLPESSPPLPSDSTKKYLPLSSSTNGSGRFGIGKKLPRADTEPLLIGKGKQKQKLSLGDMLKENIEIPEQPTNADALFDSSFMSIDSSPSLPREEHEHKQEHVATLPRHASFSGFIPDSGPVLKSKPAHRIPQLSISKSRGGAKVVERWNSQPSLFGASKRDVSRGRSTTHREPTPPPSSLPSFADQLTRSLLGEAPIPKQQLDRLSETEAYDRFEPTTPSHNVRLIYDAQPVAYWAGRLSTILDFAMNQETIRFFAEMEDDIFQRFDSDRVYDRAMNTTRIRSAFESLYACCATPDARESFVVFQLQYAALNNNPDLARPVGCTKPFVLKSRLSELNKSASSCSSPSSSTRSGSFVSRLLGRSKRSSLAS